MPLGADRHAEPDLAGTLGDGDEQDVHDPDAADQQGDRRDRGQQQRHDVAGAGRRLGDVLHVADAEVVGVAIASVVTRPQQGADFFLGLRHVGRTARRRHDVVDDAQYLAADQFPICRGERDEQGVVLVRTPPGLTLDRQHADHAARHVTDANRGVQRIMAGTEQIVGHGPAQDADPRRGAVFVTGEEAADAERPGAHVQIVRADALHVRVPVLAAGHDLHASAFDRGAGHDRRAVAHDCPNIRQTQRSRGPGRGTRPAADRIARPDVDEVRPQTLDTRLNQRIRALADGDHRDDGRHAEHDAQHGEDGAQPIAPQRPPRHAQRHAEHDDRSPRRGSWARILLSNCLAG